MNSIFEIATKISTPLVLSGITIFTLFFIYRYILKKKIFSRLKENNTFLIINRIITYLFILALVSIFLGTIGYLKTNKENNNFKDNNSIPVEKLEPQFKINSQNNLKSKGSFEQSNINIQKASFYDFGQMNIIQDGLSIVHERDSTDGSFPIKFFTILNRTGNSVVINRAAADIVKYAHCLSSSPTGKLKPLVIWDAEIPAKEGYFEYKPKNPILIANEDAVIIGVRFYFIRYGRIISPSENGDICTLRFIFLTDRKRINAKSSLFNL